MQPVKHIIRASSGVIIGVLPVSQQGNPPDLARLSGNYPGFANPVIAMFDYFAGAGEKMKRSTVFVVFAYLYISAGCTPTFFKSDEISASVVDEHTGRPVNGAVVVVEWEINHGEFHGHTYKNLHTVEVVTDDTGHFLVPGWGPKYAGMTWNMRGTEPTAYILKEGYLPKRIYNLTGAYGGDIGPNGKIPDTIAGEHSRSNIVVSWNNIEVKLTPASGDLESYAYILSGFSNLCASENDWRTMPLCIIYFDKERTRLLALGVNKARYINISVARLSPEARKFLREKSRE